MPSAESMYRLEIDDFFMQDATSQSVRTGVLLPALDPSGHLGGWGQRSQCVRESDESPSEAILHDRYLLSLDMSFAIDKSLAALNRHKRCSRESAHLASQWLLCPPGQ